MDYAWGGGAVMRNTPEDFYFNLVFFMLASQLYFYVLGPNSLLDY